MADSKLIDLQSAAALNGSEIIYGVQSGNDVKITASQIKTFAGGVTSITWGSISGNITDQSDLNTALNSKAPLASPAFTGTPTAPTAASADNSTQLATTAFVKNNFPVRGGQLFKSGIDFTTGTTTELTLTNGVLPKSAADIAAITFDGFDQQSDQWTFNPATNKVTFTDPIRIGTQSIEVKWGALGFSSTAPVTSVIVNGVTQTGNVTVNIPAQVTPAGSNSYIQFNNGGAFGADAGLMWDNTNKLLGVNSTGFVPTNRITVGSPSASLSNITATDGIAINASQSTIGLAVENPIASGTSGGTYLAAISNDGAAVASGDRLGGLLMMGSSSATQITNGASVTAFAAANWTASATPTRLDFETVSTGTTVRTTKVSVQPTGNLTIGTTTDVALNIIEANRATTGGLTMRIQNPTVGTANFARSTVASDTGNTYITTTSSTFTTNGMYVTASSGLEGLGVGGLSIASSNAAGVIRFYTAGNAAANERARIDANGYFGVGNTTLTAAIDAPASTTTRASLRVRPGVAPTTPNDGDIWQDGVNLFIRINGVTRTII